MQNSSLHFLLAHSGIVLGAAITIVAVGSVVLFWTIGREEGM